MMACCKAGVISASSVFIRHFWVGFRKAWSTLPSAASTMGEYRGAGGRGQARSRPAAIKSPASRVLPSRHPVCLVMVKYNENRAPLFSDYRDGRTRGLISVTSRLRLSGYVYCRISPQLGEIFAEGNNIRAFKHNSYDFS